MINVLLYFSEIRERKSLLQTQNDKYWLCWEKYFSALFLYVFLLITNTGENGEEKRAQRANKNRNTNSEPLIFSLFKWLLFHSSLFHIKKAKAKHMLEEGNEAIYRCMPEPATRFTNIYVFHTTQRKKIWEIRTNNRQHHKQIKTQGYINMVMT